MSSEGPRRRSHPPTNSPAPMWVEDVLAGSEPIVSFMSVVLFSIVHEPR